VDLVGPAPGLADRGWPVMRPRSSTWRAAQLRRSLELAQTQRRYVRGYTGGSLPLVSSGLSQGEVDASSAVS
jgi:hypothetical protein